MYHSSDVRDCASLVLARRLRIGVRDGGDELLDDLATRLAAQLFDLLDLLVCVRLCVVLCLLVAGAVLLYC